MEIKIDAMQDTVKKLLKDFGTEAEDAVEEAASETAKNAKKELKANSPRGSGAGDHYADGWSYGVEKSRVGVTQVRVYNGRKPGLTHLLENGHATKNGTGRSYPDTPAHPHIAEVNEKAQTDFVDLIEQKLDF